MTDEPKRPDPSLDELNRLIADGGLDPQSQIIVFALLKVARGVNDIKAQLKNIQTSLRRPDIHLAFADIAIAEIHSIYAHLQEMVSAEKAGKFGRARVMFHERIQHLEQEVKALELGGKE
jgi:hypothetical protein